MKMTKRKPRPTSSDAAWSTLIETLKQLRPRDGAPISINKTTWLYVEDKALCVVHRGDIFYLPWKAVRLAVDERAKPLPQLVKGREKRT